MGPLTREPAAEPFQPDLKSGVDAGWILNSWTWKAATRAADWLMPVEIWTFRDEAASDIHWSGPTRRSHRRRTLRGWW